MGIRSGAGRCVDFRKSWFVTFYYNNRKLPVTIEGNCVYPYNFEAFRKLMNFYPIDAPKEVRLAQMKKDQQRRVEKIAV